jgi:hypothetical protein
MGDPKFYSPVQEHREAVRLAWKCCHIPVGAILGTLFVLWSLLPTILTIVMQSPSRALLD